MQRAPAKTIRLRLALDSKFATPPFGQVRGATRPGFNTTLLGNVELLLPSLREQTAIVEELEVFRAKIDTLKAIQREGAAELDALLPSVLAKAFAGSFRPK